MKRYWMYALALTLASASVMAHEPGEKMTGHLTKRDKAQIEGVVYAQWRDGALCMPDSLYLVTDTVTDYVLHQLSHEMRGRRHIMYMAWRATYALYGWEVVSCDDFGDAP